MSLDMPAASNGLRKSELRQKVVIGVLALQGAFAEHYAIISKLASPSPSTIVLSAMLVRTADDLRQCDALIIPGGESTTIASVASRSGMLDILREFCLNKQKPVWGTCAGCILMAAEASKVKRGGQELFGGVGISVLRNGFGSQLESFEADLDIPSIRDPQTPFTGVFIRAPIIQSLLPAYADDTQILARLPSHFLPSSIVSDTDEEGPDRGPTIVALRQGRKMITTFHPELTRDDRLHEFFVKACVLQSFPDAQ